MGVDKFRNCSKCNKENGEIMILELTNLNLKVDYNDDDLKIKCCKKLNAKASDIIKIHKLRESIDARKKDDVHYVLNVGVEVTKNYKNKKHLKETNVDYSGLSYKKIETDSRPVIIGFGPSGMFTGLALSKMGLNPIIFEQGKDVDTRKIDVENFWQNGILNIHSNIQFGEGGAGTFSDGKLNTNINNELNRKIYNEFIIAGAPKEIYYKSKPHIGSDNLPQIIKNIRKTICNNGGEILFNHKLKNLIIENNKIIGAKIVNLENKEEKIINTNHLILAIGHSTLDTFEMLKENNIQLKPKPFAIGVRIEQNQKKINFSQYGNYAPYLPSADYKIVTHLDNGRSVFTFCMCPGGHVIASTCEEGTIVTNGMSNFKRDAENANSALLVNVTPKDYFHGNVLDGFYFQRKYEHKAFEIAGENYSAPIQTVGDFLAKNDKKLQNNAKNNEKTRNNNVFYEKCDNYTQNTTLCSDTISPTYRPNVHYCNIEECLPEFVTESLKQALPILNNKVKHFADDDCLLTAIETRTSCPVIIVRDSDGETNIKGLYPIGEGAGFAGGIMTSAIDGINCAERIYRKLTNMENVKH